jgi:type I restriction enzyme, S subunit
MNNGWKTKMLGDLCQTGSGGTPLKLRKEYYEGGTIPWLLSGEVAQGEVVGATNFITEDGLANSSAKIFPKNTVLVAMYGATAGQVGILRFEAATNQAVCGIFPNEHFIPEFLFYFMLSRKDELVAQAAGNAQPNISQIKIRNTAVPIVPLPEQRRIVSALDEAFEGIATAKANAEKNLQNARALFESRLQSVFTQRGMGWVEKSVGDLVAEGTLVKPFDGNHGEIHPRKADYTESGVPFIMAFDLQNGNVDTEHCTFISRKLADSLRVGFAKDGDVLISHKGTIGRSAIVRTEDEYIMLTPQVTSYRVKDHSKLLNRFIRYYFMSPVFQQEIVAGAADGSTRAYIGITKQLSLRFRFPPLAEQKRVAAELDALDAETQRLASLYERKLGALEDLKKSLLHQAFTGNL